jgi:2-polyprenyl-6-methoxyphenol hydroxylase-like FAD-dependent oxidoreductase
MDFEYEVVIIGGAFSGAATALMLKRKRPEARVLIIEKTTEFDRKVGESTTEVSSCSLSRSSSTRKTGVAPVVFESTRSAL